jgi:tetratricopeptide (TPR) repeat protein
MKSIHTFEDLYNTLNNSTKLKGSLENRTLELKSNPIFTEGLVEHIQSGANGIAPLLQIVIGADGKSEEAKGISFPITSLIGEKNEKRDVYFADFDKYRLHLIESVASNTDRYFEGLLEIREIPLPRETPLADVKYVIVLEVPQSPYRPHQHKKQRKYFIRADGLKREMSIFEVEEAIRARDERTRTQGLMGVKVCDPGLCWGRDELVAREVAALVQCRGGRSLLVLGGMGYGKTTLTEKVGAHEDLGPRFGERRWFADLTTARDAANMLAVVAAAIGLQGTASLPAVLSKLGEQPSLLVLDNLETPWENPLGHRAVERLLRELRAVPNLALLASARGDKPIGGDWTQVESLSTLPREASSSLFHEIARRIKPNDPDLLFFLDVLGDMPLAIRLVATCAAGRETLARLRTEWKQVGVPGIAPELASAIELSLLRLPEEGERLFSILGELPAGIAMWDVETFTGSPTAAFRATGQLGGVGLAEERDGRIDLLPPIRDYARHERRPRPGDVAIWHRHYLGLVAKLGSFLNRRWSTEFAERLVPEVANVEAAFRAVLDRHDLERAKRAGERLWLLTRFSGRGSVATQQDLMKLCRIGGDEIGEANCAFCIGDIELYRSKHAAALKYLERARKLYHHAGDFRGEAECNCALGETALERSHYNKARKHFDKALKLYREAKRARRRNEAKWIGRGEAECIMRRGDVALRHESNYDEARKRFQQARLLYHRARYKLGEANCIQRFGDVTVAEGGLDGASEDAARKREAARKEYDDALRRYRSAGSHFGQANCYRGFGDVALAARQFDAAEAAFKEAMVLYQRVGNTQGEGICMRSLGEVLSEKGDYDEARAQYRRGLKKFEEIKDGSNIKQTQARLSRLAEL